MDLSLALRLQELPLKPVVALTGAGGKSTLLFRLGAELAAAGRQTVLTATTRLWAKQVDRAPFTILSASPQVLAQELPISLRGYRQVLVAQGPAAEPGKVQGLAPDLVCRLNGLADVDAVVVEADGSRERPLKAPAGHEPVVPVCATHVLVVAGMRALGRPLAGDTVHRPEQAAHLAGLAVGEPLSIEAVARLLCHPQGGLKGVPPGAQAFLYLNLAVDATTPAEVSAQRLAAGRQLARLALQAPGFQAVLLGSGQAEQPVDEVHGRVAGIILAAGEATRMASSIPKQILPWGEANTLVGHVVDLAQAAQDLREVVVVTGYEAAAVAAAVQGRTVRCAANPRWAEGQSSSVRAGLAAVGRDSLAAVFLLADQPHVSPAVIDALIQAHRQTLAPAVVPLYRGARRGNPVLFDRSLFQELMALSGDVGGRAVIQRLGEAVHGLPIDDDQPVGIETWEDYLRQRAAADATHTGD
jgi:molybdenum cofactor cytidylyltransferase